MMKIRLLIATFLLLLPVVALSGGPPQQQIIDPRVVVNIPEDKGFFSSEVIAAFVVGGLGLAGILLKKAQKNNV